MNRPRWLAGFFAGLTLRGRCVVASGIAALGPGLLLREVNVTRIGVFLIAAPAVSSFMVSRTRYRLTCSRRLDPVRGVDSGPGRRHPGDVHERRGLNGRGQPT